MTTNQLNNLTCLIPLYQSKRFLNIIVENIDEHLALGASVLVSDKHSLDDTAQFLKNRYAGNQNVTIYTSNDQSDWVDNINFLITKTKTKYARIIPHDDSASSESSLILMQSLAQNPDAVMASGIVKAYDIDDNPIPQRDELNAKENKENKSWSFHDIMDFFWKGRFAGSFKGVFHADTVKNKNVLIKKTPTLIHSERLWLAALSMIGRYQFEPTAILRKRYHKSSTHSQWTIKPDAFLDSANVLWKYAEELISDQALLSSARFIIYHNAIRRARYLDNKTGKPPGYTSITTG